MTGPRPLRVLMTADPIGGVWTYACELIGALAPHRVEVVLATMGAPLSEAQRRAVRELPNAMLAEGRFALEWMPEPWRDVDAAADWLRGLAQHHAVDAVHVNGFAHAGVDLGAPALCAIHSCVVTWMRAVRRCEPGPAWAEYRARTARGLAAASQVVAPTAAILEEVLAAHGVARRGRAIPNGRTASAFPPAEKQPFVLAAGRLWDEAKGLAELDACAGSVRWPIRVAGPTTGPIPAPSGGADILARSGGADIPARSGGAERGPERGEINPGQVRRLGPLEPAELAAWMGRASIFALPARYEPFGLGALEAALAGCALVLSDLPTLREVWGERAAYVPPRDPEALAFALEALIRDPLRRGALGGAARARALALTPARMAAAYREVYDGLAPTARREVCA